MFACEGARACKRERGLQGLSWTNSSACALMFFSWRTAGSAVIAAVTR
jgi:hypothetical protein